jgi:hypothetical protein
LPEEDAFEVVMAYPDDFEADARTKQKYIMSAERTRPPRPDPTTAPMNSRLE